MRTMLRTTYRFSKGGAKVEVYLCRCRHILCCFCAICAKVVLLCATRYFGGRKKQKKHLFEGAIVLHTIKKSAPTTYQ